MEKYPDIQIKGFNFDPPGKVQGLMNTTNPNSTSFRLRPQHVHLEDSRGCEVSLDGAYRKFLRLVWLLWNGTTIVLDMGHGEQALRHHDDVLFH